MPNTLTPLNPAAAYIYCPDCAKNGTPGVMLKRNQVNELSCAFGHKPVVTAIQSGAATSLGTVGGAAEMSPFSTVMRESPDSTWVKWPVWVHPQVRALIESKFPDNWIHSVATLLAAFADGSLLIITGDEARKIKDHGAKNGAQIVSALEATKQAQKERDDAVQQLDRLQQVLKAAGI
jgi:hypothetical protein